MTVYAQKIAGKPTGRWLVEINYTSPDPANPKGGKDLNRRYRETVKGSKSKADKRNRQLLKEGVPAASGRVLAAAGVNLQELADQCVKTEYLGKAALYKQ